MEEVQIWFVCMDKKAILIIMLEYLYEQQGTCNHFDRRQ